MTENIGSGFRNADGELFSKLVRCLDFMNELPFIKAYKSHSWQTLKKAYPSVSGATKYGDKGRLGPHEHYCL